MKKDYNPAEERWKLNKRYKEATSARKNGEIKIAHVAFKKIVCNGPYDALDKVSVKIYEESLIALYEIEQAMEKATELHPPSPLWMHILSIFKRAY